MFRTAVITIVFLGFPFICYAGEFYVQFDLSLFSYLATTQKDETDDASSEIDVKAFDTHGSSLGMAVGYDNWNLYLSPLTDQSSVGVGYVFTKSFEAGLFAGYNKIETDDTSGDKITNSVNVFSPFVTFYGSSLSFTYEIFARLNYAVSKTETNAGETESTNSGLEVSAFYIREIRKGLSYTAAISYSTSDADIDTTVTGSTITNKAETALSGFGIQLAGLRLVF